MFALLVDGRDSVSLSLLAGNNTYLLAYSACCVLNLPQLVDVIRTVWIEQYSDPLNSRDKRA